MQFAEVLQLADLSKKTRRYRTIMISHTCVLHATITPHMHPPYAYVSMNRRHET